MSASQPGLFDRPVFTQGPCAFGPGDPAWLGPHHCAACADEVERAVVAMHAAVARGEYDERGYTPAERRTARRVS